MRTRSEKVDYEWPMRSMRSTQSRVAKCRPAHPIKTADRIRTWPTQLIHSEPTGLENPGNFCYRRALFQCLLHLPAFYSYLGVVHPNCKGNIDACTVCALQDLMHKYWNEVGRASFPRAAVDQLDRAIKANGVRPDGSKHWFADARTKAQGDPHELFMFMFEKLEEKEHHRSKRLDRLFNIRFQNGWTCKHCPNTVERECRNNGYEIHVQRDTEKSLMDHLREFHAQSLDWRCDQAACPATGQQHLINTHRITQAPEILRILLNRSDPTDLQAGKIQDHVVYPEVLDLTPFTPTGSQLLYRLHGVVSHCGPSSNEGHYIATVRKRGGQAATINDDVIERTHGLYDMHRPTSKGRNFDPVLLFYLKT